jgi:hypothetical protein
MKAWIRDNYYMDKIPAKRLKDNALVRIFPLRDDPADATSSQRFPTEDRVETIVWHGEEYEVFSVDLQWQNSRDIISPTSFNPSNPTTISNDAALYGKQEERDKSQPTKGFIEALNDYCQDYYIHYDGFPVEFEYKDKVYPFEYFIDYIEDKTNA